MDSFEAKIGWRRIRKRENKSSRSIPFRSYQTRNKKFQKKLQKHSKKKKKNHCGCISSRNRLEKAEKERK